VGGGESTRAGGGRTSHGAHMEEGRPGGASSPAATLTAR